MEKPSLTMLLWCLMLLLFIWAAHVDGQHDCNSDPEYRCTFPGDDFCGWNHTNNVRQLSSGGDDNEEQTKAAVPGFFKSPKFCGPRAQKKRCVVVKIPKAFVQSNFKLSPHTDDNRTHIGVTLRPGTLFVWSFQSGFQLRLHHQVRIQTSSDVYVQVWVTLTPAESNCSTNPQTAEETEAATFYTAAVVGVVAVLAVGLVLTLILFVLIRRRRRRQQPLCKMCLKNDRGDESSKAATCNAAPGLSLADPKQLRDGKKSAHHHATPQSNRPSQSLENEYSVITFAGTNENVNALVGNTAAQRPNRTLSDKSSLPALPAREYGRLSQTQDHVYTVITDPGNSQSASPGNSVDLNRDENSSAQSTTAGYNTLNFHNAGPETASKSEETKGDYNHLPPPAAETETGTGNGKPEATSVYRDLEEGEEPCAKEVGDANESHHAREHNDAGNSQLADISSAYHTLEEGRNVAPADLALGYSLQKQTGDDALFCLEKQQQQQQHPQQQHQQAEDYGPAYHILEDEPSTSTKDPPPFTYELTKTDGPQASTDFQEEEVKAEETSSTRATTETLTEYNSLDFEGKNEDGKKKAAAGTTDVYNHLNDGKTDTYNELQREKRKDIVDNEYSRVP